MTEQGATYCPQCGAVYDDNRKACTKCSIKTSAGDVGWEPAYWTCSRCNAPNSTNYRYCRNCGMSHTEANPASAAVSPGPQGLIQCSNCGRWSLEGTVSPCPGCGVSGPSDSGASSMPSINPIPVWTCPKCGVPNPTSSNVCRGCGDARTSSALGDAYCKKCGRSYPSGQQYCDYCPAGGAIEQQTTVAYGDWICPKCGARGVGSANNCTKCGEKLGMTIASSATRSLTGLLFEARPSAAPAWRPPMGSVPDKVDLRQYYTTVEDQSTTSSCAANAVVGALEYHQVRIGGKVRDLSRLFIYWNARRMADKEGEDAGCTMPLVMAATLGYGACREELWPFDKSKLTERPTQECYNDAGDFEAISFARVTPGDSVRAAVAAGLPVVFGAWFPGSMYDAAQSGGVMPGPAEQKEQPGAGHCMVIVGYDHPAQQWIVRNSWGGNWGDKGYVKIPYASMESYTPIDGFWVIGALEQTQGAMSGPSVKNAIKDIEKSAKQVMNEAIGRAQAVRRAEAARLGGSGTLGNYIYTCNDCGKSMSYSINNVERCPYCGGRLTYIGPGAGAPTHNAVGADKEMQCVCSACMHVYTVAANGSKQCRKCGSTDTTCKPYGATSHFSMPAAARGYQGAPLPVAARRLDGCLFETRKASAPLLVTPLGNNVPNAVDLRQFCSPVEDQGQSNSCTANATVGALEYHQRRSGGQVTDISRLFVYYNARKMADAQGQDCGSFIHHAMAAVLANGACEEQVWPFDLSQVLTQPTQQAYQNATQHEAVQYARTMLGTAVIQALAAQLPVVFGTYVPGRFYEEAQKTGIMSPPAERLDPPGGGHAMLIVGYDLPSKTWLIRNSWGANWADQGYFRMPFATMEAYSSPDHFWAIGAIESKQGMSLSGPSPRQAADAVRAEAPADMREALAKLRGDLRSDLQSELDKQKADIRNRLRGDKP